MRITYINQEGQGFAGWLEVEEGTTVPQLFHQKMGESADPNDYTIRVNRQDATADQVLVAGDRVSITPRKVEGSQPSII